MDEAGIRPDELGQMRQEGDDVVLGLALDLVDALDVECGRAALFPDRPGRLLRDDAEFGQRVAGMRLDLEPDAEAGFRRPDGDHFRPRIARDHLGQFQSEANRCRVPNRGGGNAQRATARKPDGCEQTRPTNPSGKNSRSAEHRELIERGEHREDELEDQMTENASACHSA